MKDKAKGQAPVDAQWNASRLADEQRQGIELAAKDGGYLISAAGAAADFDKVIGMGGGRGLVRHEIGHSTGQAGSRKDEPLSATELSSLPGKPRPCRLS